MSIDSFLTDKLDAVTWKLQRRGVPLTEIHLMVSGTAFISSVVSSVPGPKPEIIVPLSVVIWGSFFVVNWRWGRKNRDYFESVEKTEKLNKEVVFNYRQNEVFVRYMWLYFALLFLPLELVKTVFSDRSIGLSAFNILGVLSCPLVFWLNVCLFTGPGHFSKETKTELSGNEVFDN